MRKDSFNFIVKLIKVFTILNKGKNKTIYVYLLSKSFSDILHHQCLINKHILFCFYIYLISQSLYNSFKQHDCLLLRFTTYVLTWSFSLFLKHLQGDHCTAQKMEFSIKDFFSDQIRSFLRNWSHLLKKFLMKIFIFCAVFMITPYLRFKSGIPKTWLFISLLCSSYSASDGGISLLPSRVN